VPKETPHHLALGAVSPYNLMFFDLLISVLSRFNKPTLGLQNGIDIQQENNLNWAEITIAYSAI
jgi:hypothetical protein